VHREGALVCPVGVRFEAGSNFGNVRHHGDLLFSANIVNRPNGSSAGCGPCLSFRIVQPMLICLVQSAQVPTISTAASFTRNS
jgi:hypothetical protein